MLLTKEIAVLFMIKIFSIRQNFNDWRKTNRREIRGGSIFHPRIVLISDGNLTPSKCIIGNTNLPDLNTPDKEEETLVGTVLTYNIEHIKWPLAIDQFYLHRSIYIYLRTVVSNTY